ncbi:MAG: 3-deoxy-7-phosphoheptulonate synthase [Thiotrichaceae bacterium]
MNVMDTTDNLRIADTEEVANPVDLFKEYPINSAAIETVQSARDAIHQILRGEDDRLLVVVGPCSIHDPKAALEYAERLAVLRNELSADLVIVMRVYFEKPRTRVGWKGLINDPDLTDEFNINKGLRKARKLLLELASHGMPAATEYLDLISPQYISDLISWAAIGARTTESQGHRELASGVSCPIGFKNGTNGNLNIAIDAIAAANRPHRFLSVNKLGHSSIFATTGNDDCHIILRGGKKPNYDEQSVESAIGKLNDAELSPHLMVDMSHANSSKDFRNQPKVATEVARQISAGSDSICGVMIESHLIEGQQNGNNKSLQQLTYGQSITDACIGWDDTDSVLRQLSEAVKHRRVAGKSSSKV